jgi:hypothetical protein
MPQRAIHCPFLNRSDTRCSSHFSLDHLSDAFEQCMDAYQTCPVYLELLAERRERRGEPMLAIYPMRPGERTTQRPDGKPRDVTIVSLTLAGGRRVGPLHHA